MWTMGIWCEYGVKTFDKNYIKLQNLFMLTDFQRSKCEGLCWYVWWNWTPILYYHFIAHLKSIILQQRKIVQGTEHNNRDK